MIVDTLNNLSLYKGIHPNLDTAIDYLQTHDLSSLPMGKNIIDGENVFVSIVNETLRTPEEASYEYHRLYADIQINIEGEESWEFSTEGTKDSFDVDRDLGFASCTTYIKGDLRENRFAIFLPCEFHKPTLVYGTCTQVKKAIVKVKMR